MAFWNKNKVESDIEIYEKQRDNEIKTRQTDKTDPRNNIDYERHEKDLMNGKCNNDHYSSNENKEYNQEAIKTKKNVYVVVLVIILTVVLIFISVGFILFGTFSIANTTLHSVEQDVLNEEYVHKDLLDNQTLPDWFESAYYPYSWGESELKAVKRIDDLINCIDKDLKHNIYPEKALDYLIGFGKTDDYINIVLEQTWLYSMSGTQTSIMDSVIDKWVKIISTYDLSNIVANSSDDYDDYIYEEFIRVGQRLAEMYGKKVNPKPYFSTPFIANESDKRIWNIEDIEIEKDSTLKLYIYVDNVAIDYWDSFPEASFNSVYPDYNIITSVDNNNVVKLNNYDNNIIWANKGISYMDAYLPIELTALSDGNFVLKIEDSWGRTLEYSFIVV